jgi:hypothetical protein
MVAVALGLESVGALYHMPVSWSIPGSLLLHQLVTPRTSRSRINSYELQAVAFTNNGGAVGIVVTFSFVVNTRLCIWRTLLSGVHRHPRRDNERMAYRRQPLHDFRPQTSNPR